MATYCFDIDRTIFATEDSDYPNSKPIPHRIAHVNKLYDEGHQITIFTARGTLTGIDWRELTLGQLEKWGGEISQTHTRKAPCRHIHRRQGG